MKSKLTKRISCSILVLAMLLLTINVAVFAAVTGTDSAMKGTGTKDDPYQVSQASQLKELEGKSDVFVKLTADIDLSKAETQGRIDDWYDYYIGTFSGTIDGQNHRIYNSANQSALIGTFNGGTLENINFELKGSPATLAFNAVKAADYNYTNINISGPIKYGANNNNEAPLVNYAAGNTTLTNVHVSSDIESPTYNGIFIGYTPYANSKYKLENCTYSGNAIMKQPGIIFGNGYRLNLISDGSSSMEVKNCSITGSVLGTAAEPKFLGSVSFKPAYDTIEAAAKSGFTVTGTIAKAPDLSNYSYQVNDQGNVKISVGTADSSIASFKVVSSAYANVYNKDGSLWGTQLLNIAEDIPVVADGQNYFSTLGKVLYYDGNDGRVYNTGVNGALKAVDVNGKLGYAIPLKNDAFTYKFGELNAKDTWKETYVAVFAYDKDGKLLNTINGGTKGTFTVDQKSVSTPAGTELSKVTAPTGYTWVSPTTKVVAGEQICFASTAEHNIIPVKVIGTQVPVVDTPPVIDPTKPVEDVQVGVTQETAQTLDNIINDKTDATISADLKTKIDQAKDRGEQVKVSVKSEAVKDSQVAPESVEKIKELLTSTQDKDVKQEVQQYFDFAVQVSANDVVLGDITNLNSSKITMQIAIPKDLQKDRRTFEVVRVHDGKAEVLDSTIKDHVLTFDTNKFSTYALISKDVNNPEIPTPENPDPNPNPNPNPEPGTPNPEPGTPNPEPGTPNPNPGPTDTTNNGTENNNALKDPKTGDTFNIVIWSIVAGVSAAVLVAVIIISKKKFN